MDIQSLYDSIYLNNIESLRRGNIVIDDNLCGDIIDDRRGISLIIPLCQISPGYAKLVNIFQQIEPEQYYYPAHDLHITLFDYIAAHAAYSGSDKLDATYTTLAQSVLTSLKSFSIVFKGIVFSREAGIITGYDDGSIAALRKRIRQHLVDHGLPNLERYESISVHASFLRFKKRIRKEKDFIAAIESWRSVDIGTEVIKKVLLVEHDWYNRRQITRPIKQFALE
jgi:hypothetical protein